MHAIHINPETIEKIHRDVPEDSPFAQSVEIYLRLRSQWYMIKDYCTPGGIFYPYTILPAFIVETQFIIDKDVAAKDWDTVYRLA